MKIEFEIKSKGTMLVKYGIKSATIQGELVFEPPTFYADSNSLKNWNPPFENEKIENYQKTEIMDFISNHSFHTKIIFE